VTRLAAALALVAGCHCRSRAAEQQHGYLPVAASPGSGAAAVRRLALPMLDGVSVCDLVPVAEVAVASQLPVDQAFARDAPSSATCVYQSGSDTSTAVSIAVVARFELASIEHKYPGGAPLRGIAKDNWYVDQADDDASVLYVQDGDAQVTVAVDNEIPADRRAVIAEKLAQLALTRR
jgi:hypothetical protein